MGSLLEPPALRGRNLANDLTRSLTRCLPGRRQPRKGRGPLSGRCCPPAAPAAPPRLLHPPSRPPLSRLPAAFLERHRCRLFRCSQEQRGGVPPNTLNLEGRGGCGTCPASRGAPGGVWGCFLPAGSQVQCGVARPRGSRGERTVGSVPGISHPKQQSSASLAAGARAPMHCLTQVALPLSPFFFILWIFGFFCFVLFGLFIFQLQSN